MLGGVLLRFLFLKRRALLFQTPDYIVSMELAGGMDGGWIVDETMDRWSNE